MYCPCYLIRTAGHFSYSVDQFRHHVTTNPQTSISCSKSKQCQIKACVLQQRSFFKLEYVFPYSGSKEQQTTSDFVQVAVKLAYNLQIIYSIMSLLLSASGHFLCTILNWNLYVAVTLMHQLNLVNMRLTLVFAHMATISTIFRGILSKSRSMIL